MVVYRRKMLGQKSSNQHTKAVEVTPPETSKRLRNNWGVVKSYLVRKRVFTTFFVLCPFLLFIYFSFNLLRQQQQTLYLDEHVGYTVPEVCSYEGNCPPLTICGSSGRCLPYLTAEVIGAKIQHDIEASQQGGLRDPRNVPNLQTSCVSRCLADASNDERFFFGSNLTVLASFDYKGGRETPNGCVVAYQRSPSLLASLGLEEWRAGRLGVVQRRDPFPEEHGKGEFHQRWAVLCYDPCQTDDDCSPQPKPKEALWKFLGARLNTEDAKAAFVCSPESQQCKRHNRDARSAYLMDSSKVVREHGRIVSVPEYSDLTVVSYATNDYFQGLRELAASLRYWAPYARLAIYNLGLTLDQIKEAEGWSNVVGQVNWRDGMPDTYPEHIRTGKKYAWKPLLMKEAARKYRKILVFDAGNVVRGPLNHLELILEQTGDFLVWGQDEDMTKQALPVTFEWFNLTKGDFRNRPSYSGNTQGYLYPSHAYDHILVPLEQCALDSACIAPAGSKTANHRFDQTALSIISYMPDMMPFPHTEYLAAARSQLSENFRDASDKIIWTARQGSNDYYNANY